MRQKMRKNNNNRAVITAGLAALALAFLATSVYAGAHEGSAGTLGKEDRVMLSTFMEDFVTGMDAKYFGRVEQMNGGIEFEDRFVEGEYGDYKLRVARGEIMEKAGRMNTIGRINTRGEGVLTWGKFYSLDMHPKTPLVGMLHATIVLQMFEDGSVATGGWLGVMPGAKVEEDLALLKKLTDDYFAAHDKDPALYRRLICKGTEDTIAEFRRKPACSGVSFYGPPVYRGDPEASIKFIAGLFDEFVDAYIDITEKRSTEGFTEADLAAQEKMRRNWLIDQLFSDPYAKAIVPFDVWSFANVPPVIKF
ncbi:MAG: hypothetical protein CL799_08585 [Chromatiales bacterium]|jgi:coproporphyrinogen III oxidase|nr:hypothetical protein [Chromatiales bacterium]MDP6151647.1 hypothetical protein [Gammaproteobacteria bacterium]MDP7269902.1 hypothetical protein [Gammaproteobacteria bacterium]HJP04934.1 hypothetical protein [Gammaproteobacteria bacterium]